VSAHVSLALTREGPHVTDISRLPGPRSDKWEWQLLGACRAHDTDLFFHPEGERGPNRSNREASAKAICAGCPVIVECREAALAAREPYGVWGGLSEHERETILARREHATAS
jgi:WhiB family redox-sensing transcriptional regulator